MTVVIHGVHEEIDELLERRRALGQDGRDEVWDGVYHMAPHAHVNHGVLQVKLVLQLAARLQAQGYVMVNEFNLGLDKQNYRVPDFGALDGNPGTLYVPSAVMIGEIVSPDDETFEKFDFYHSRGVQEIVVVLPDTRQITCYGRTDAGYAVTPQIQCAGISALELSTAIDWP